jgi:hypothetical protein
MEMNWQEIIKPTISTIETHTQYPQNPQNYTEQFYSGDIGDIGNRYSIQKKVEKFTPVKLGNPHNKKQTIPPGNTWLKDHAEELRAAGFCHKDLYNNTWPVGVADLNLWNKPGLRVELRGDQLCFTWTNQTGGRITQSCRPEQPKRE